jgi:peptidoglycan hydrolase-like protein with peptidoglycan-binding domain
VRYHGFSDTPVLQRGSKGQAVKDLQALLESRGYSVGSHGIDGDFGVDTDAALRNFQATAGLPITGVADAATWATLSGAAPTQEVEFTEGEAEQIIGPPGAKKGGMGTALLIGAGVILAYYLYA